MLLDVPSPESETSSVQHERFCRFAESGQIISIISQRRSHTVTCSQQQSHLLHVGSRKVAMEGREDNVVVQHQT